MKRLREAQNVKVQPNKTGTSFMQGQPVYYKKNSDIPINNLNNDYFCCIKYIKKRNKLMI